MRSIVVAGAAGAAAGSIASQGVGIAIGQQQNFSWSGVAEAAVCGAVAGGFSALNVAGKLTGALSGLGNASRWREAR